MRMNKYSLLVLSVLILCTEAHAGKNLRFVKNPFNHDYSRVNVYSYPNTAIGKTTNSYLSEIFKLGEIKKLADSHGYDFIPVSFSIANFEVRYPVELFSDTNTNDCTKVKKVLNVKAPSKIDDGIIQQFSYQLITGSCVQGNLDWPTAHYIHIKTTQLHPYDKDIKGDCGHRRGIHESFETTIQLYTTVYFTAANGDKEIRYVSCKANERSENNEYDNVPQNDRERKNGNLSNNRIVLNLKNCVGIEGHFEQMDSTEAFYFQSEKNELNLHQILPGFTQYTHSLETEYLNNRNN